MKKPKIPKVSEVIVTRAQLDQNGFRSAQIATIVIQNPDGTSADASVSIQLDYKGRPTVRVEDFNSPKPSTVRVLREKVRP